MPKPEYRAAKPKTDKSKTTKPRTTKPNTTQSYTENPRATAPRGINPHAAKRRAEQAHYQPATPVQITPQGFGPKPNNGLYDCFASCPHGLENLLQTEISCMGAQNTVCVRGGVEFIANWQDATRMTYWSRFAGRIGLRVAHGPCTQESHLYDLAKIVPWWDWFRLSHAFRIDLSSLGSPLPNLRFAQLRVKDAICDAFKARFDERPNVSIQTPDVRIFGALKETQAMLYIDLAGDNLFKRGWRQDQGAAPLKENLAAGLWRILRNSPQGQEATVFMDPFCGSGTLLVEALSELCDRAPGLERRFGFENLKPYQPEWGETLQQEANQRFNQGLDLALQTWPFTWHGSDVTALLVDMTTANLQRAGFGELLDAGLVNIRQCNALDALPPAPSGCLLTNPPYGERIRAKGATLQVPSEHSVGENPEEFLTDDAYTQLFTSWGSLLKQHYSGWTAWVFSGDLELRHGLGLAPKRKTPLFNGPIECRLFEFLLSSGTYRPRATQSQTNG